LITVLSAPFVLPTTVAVMGLLSVFGRNGPVNETLVALGIAPISIFGLHGVVLANVFLNLPLATRMLLQGWNSIPSERFRLAQALGMTPRSHWLHLEIPMLRANVPAVVLVIFLICLTSFSIALMLGGGPAASTLELGVYQSLRFDFDLGRAASLATLQLCMCAFFTFFAWFVTIPQGFASGLDRPTIAFSPKGWRRQADALVIILCAAFLIVPMYCIVVNGSPALGDLHATVLWSALRSILVAVASTMLCASASLILTYQVARSPSILLETAAMLPIATSSLVFGTGLFLWVRPWLNPETIALPITILTNTLLALPFLFRILLPVARQIEADYGKLSRSLGLKGLANWRFVVLPRLSRPLGFGAGLAAALSMGDLGVIAIFGANGRATLPLEVQRLMGAFRMDEAAAAGLVLILISFLLFWIFDRLGEYYAGA
jgi:thiamine transport system permease protein